MHSDMLTVPSMSKSSARNGACETLMYASKEARW